MCRKCIITGTNKIRPKRKGNFDREVKVTFLFLKKEKIKMEFAGKIVYHEIRKVFGRSLQ